MKIPGWEKKVSKKEYSTVQYVEKYRKGMKLVVTVKNSVEEKGIVMNIGIL